MIMMVKMKRLLDLREVKSKPDKYAYVARKVSKVEGSSFEEALQSAELNEWEQAIYKGLKILRAQWYMENCRLSKTCERGSLEVGSKTQANC